MSNVLSNLSEIKFIGSNDQVINFKHKNKLLSFEVDPWDEMGDDRNFGTYCTKYYADISKCQIGEIIELHKLIYDVGFRTTFNRKLSLIKTI